MTRESFLLRILIEPGPLATHCWLWQKARNKRGYGVTHYDGKQRLAHCVSYLLFVGSYADDLELDHLCRVPACCCPDHLEPVTHQMNCQRGNHGLIGRSKTHCPHGHQYTPENTYRHPARPRERFCRRCAYLANQRHRANKKVLT